MNRVWEQGDTTIQRIAEEADLRGRDYVFKAIEKGKGPFLDLRKVRRDDGTVLFVYRTNDCCDWERSLTETRCRRELLMPFYLKIMELLLKALELAEDQMILSGTFLLQKDTIFYHRPTGSVRLAYVPCSKAELLTGQLLLESLEWMEEIEPDFKGRWPFLEETFLELFHCRAGRNRCRTILHSWRKEFPEEKLFW